MDSTTAAVPTLFTLSAWGAYIIGIIETSYQELSYNGNPTSDFLAGVPYQYYTIGSIVMVLIIAVTGWDYGPMKRAEDRALKTGKLVEDGAEVRSHTEKRELPAGAKPSIWNMIIPLVVLIVLIFVGMAYTGDAATNGFVGALAAGSSLKSLVIAFFITGRRAGHPLQGHELQGSGLHLYRGLLLHDGSAYHHDAGLGDRQRVQRLRHQ